MQGVIPLHITDNIDALDKIVGCDKLKVRKAEQLDRALGTLYNTLLKTKNDQETCYILGRRLINSVEFLSKISTDKKFILLKYGSELNKAKSVVEELRPALIKRYEENAAKRCKEEQDKKKTTEFVKQQIVNIPSEKAPIFAEQFISCGTLYKAIQDHENMLLIDIRTKEEYEASQIKFDDVINIPENIINHGLSANALGNKLDEKTQRLWDKRDSFNVLVLLDWNSDSDSIYCSKIEPLKASVVEWDIRKYRQHPVILNGGFKDFLESYPSMVTNILVNLIRKNEEVDELLELDSISYSDSSINTIQFKQFTIDNLEETESGDELEKADKDKELKEIENKSKILGGFSPDISNISSSHFYDSEETEKQDPVKPEENNIAESNDTIRKRIEEERLKLLYEARNAKTKPSINSFERPEGDTENPNSRYIIPPPICRETKPLSYSVAIGEGWCALVNIRNTCYMNTVLQCLKCIPIIKQAFVVRNYQKHISRASPLIIIEFVNAIRELWCGTEYEPQIFRPIEFYEKVCKLDKVYRKGDHEDCMEFFLFLFNHLNDDCALPIKRPKVFTEKQKSWYGHLQGSTSIWVDLFYHQFQCTKICKSCNSHAVSYEMDNTLMLPVPNNPSLRSIHLNTLIEEYMDDNQILDYKCSKCQQMRVINRKTVAVAPEILVIVLKRYYQDEYQETRKNNVPVDFSLKLQFGDFNYKLYSVAEHRGTMTHGHYFAHGIISDNKQNDLWLEFNDERLIKFQNDWDNIRGSACAFFYQRR